MIKTAIEQLAEPIGFDLGYSDDTTQAALRLPLGWSEWLQEKRGT